MSMIITLQKMRCVNLELACHGFVKVLSPAPTSSEEVTLFKHAQHAAAARCRFQSDCGRQRGTIVQRACQQPFQLSRSLRGALHRNLLRGGYRKLAGVWQGRAAEYKPGHGVPGSWFRRKSIAKRITSSHPTNRYLCGWAILPSWAFVFCH